MTIKKENGMNKFFRGVYLWMFAGLLLSGVMAYLTATNPTMTNFVYNNLTLVIILELVVAIAFIFLRRKVSANTAKILFIIYSLTSGLTMSSIFLVYKLDSIIMVFFSAALLFGLLAAYGYYTNNDLTSFGRLLTFGLIAVLIMSVINLFIFNSTFGVVISVISVVVFLGLTAWDMQNLKRIYEYYSNDEEELNKCTIYGALDLYLDFINIFLHLLELFGNDKD